MKLLNRVSLFFLVALAIILVAYSAAFYAFVRARLVQQFEQELLVALNSLVAAAEVEAEDVSWQPLEHTIAIGTTQGPDEIQWAVIGDGSRVVDRSRNAEPELIERAKAIASDAAAGRDGASIFAEDRWRVLHKRLVAPAPDDGNRDVDEFDDLTVVVARSAAPLNADLHRLLLVVCALPSVTWLVAGAAGRWVCRRALQPVSHMSEQIRSVTHAHSPARLPVSKARDELADLALAFNTLLERQQRAFEQQRRFTGDAAHELRTPLTVLLGQIDVALRRPRAPQEYAATLRVLRDETAQLQTIVESLLFLARAEEDAVLPDTETFSLAQWLPDYIKRWKKHPRSDDIRLQISARGDNQVRASAVLLARLLDNLIENALKYSSPGSNVEINAINLDGEVLVEVVDQGRGIDANDQAEIFDPFFRCRAAREAGIAGSGLGLAIAARIAAAFGGQLNCVSQLGHGSRFTLRLPAVSGTPVTAGR